MDWSLRACARKGHVTYRPDEQVLRDHLHTATAVGEAWRCLRCAGFVVGEPAGGGPAEAAPVVLRGRALRDATVLRVLAVERGIRGLVLLAVAYAVVRFRASQADLRDTFERALPAARPLADSLHVDLTDSAILRRLHALLASRPHTLTLVALGLLAYAALELLEAVGLFLLKRWGEYVAAVGTAAFLPLEVHELLDRVTVLRAGAFVVNVAAVIYLVLTKRLFGVRGGREAFEAERRSASLLEVEAAGDEPGGRPPRETADATGDV